MRKGRGRQDLNPAYQILAMRNRFPTLELVNRMRLTWRGPITPTEGGRAFTIEVRASWDRRGVPGVKVLAPALVNMPGWSRPPHTYANGTLCLYHREDFIWTGDQLVATTIVPWACEWAFYYETWLLTGHWEGPEYPHGPPKPDRAEGTDVAPARWAA